MTATKAQLFNDTPFVPYLAALSQMDADLDVARDEMDALRNLAGEYAAIATLPEMDVRKNRWRDINDLKGGRPVVWLNEICWHEMNVDDELTLVCRNPVARRIETDLRKTLYQWRHMAADMVVEKVYCSPYVIENSGFGIKTEADVLETDAESTIASRRFHSQIKTVADVDKIRDPVITLNKTRTEAFHHFYSRVFEGILPVEKRGATGFWFAPWDDVVYWMGAEELLMNLADEPELMHALIGRLLAAYQSALDQWVGLGISGSNNTNARIGSGGYGYTNDLPKESGAVPLAHTWGSATAQIFGSVSPAMHEEFGIHYEIEWLKRFGLSYYGCCEPLHNKIGMLSKIPNLRKISISPWADERAAADLMRGRYVMSLKPSPSPLAGPGFNEALVRKDLVDKLENTRDCCVEVILKDISTVNRDPHRLWRWVEMAMEVVGRFE